MYDFSYSLQDFPWTRVSDQSLGPESWRMPDEGWFSFVPEMWGPCIYACMLEVDTYLNKAGLMEDFIIHQVSYDAGYVQVWYGFDACNVDAEAFSSFQQSLSDSCVDVSVLQETLYKIDDAFMRLQYLTSQIPLSVPSHDDLLYARYLRDTVNMSVGASR